MPHPPRPPAAALLAAAAITIAGCSAINDPLNNPSGETPSTRDRPAGNEVRIPRTRGPSRSAIQAASPIPVEAIERFARLYVNWSARTLAARQRRLAAISVGEASSTQARAAAQTPADYELRRGGIANEGRVIAIAPVRPARLGHYVVVTRERTTGAGVYEQLEPAYHLTFATVQRISSGWAVSQWQPQI